MATPVDLLQGTLDVLVLKAISWGPRHGHGVARVIRDSTSGTLEVTDGSLYVAGRQQLKTETAAWQRYVQTVTRLLTATTQPA